jgi:hypothetical protein
MPTVPLQSANSLEVIWPRSAVRHTALTWRTDVGVELHLLQRVAGHQDPVETSRDLHLGHQTLLDIGVAYSR